MRTSLLLLIVLWPEAIAHAGQRNEMQPRPTVPSYQIQLDIDEDAASYWGNETVRYTHAGPSPLDKIWFWLIPNLKILSVKDAPPLLFVRSVEIAGQAVEFEIHDSTSVEIALPEPLAPGHSLELVVGFLGKLTKSKPEETTLAAHFTEQISQIIGNHRRRAYLEPPYFVSGGVAVLSDFYPVLALRRKGQWWTDVPRTADDNSYANVADYQLEIRVPRDVAVSALNEPASIQEQGPLRTYNWQGQGVRDLLIVIGAEYQTLSQKVGTVEVRSAFFSEDEAVGRAVLGYAAHAVSVYQSWFGPYPYPQLSLVEVPLPAGRMSASATSVIALASAYYVDFQSPRGLALPGMIRENADLIKQGVEFHVAYAVARQWWGQVVGGGWEKAHFWDNALATYGALLYYEKIYGPEIAQAQMDAQLKAAYRVYRMFGGQDQPVNQPVNRFKNSFHYTSIVHVKGALFFDALRQMMGQDALLAVLHDYYRAHQFGRIDEPDLLRRLHRAAGAQGDQMTQLYQQWIVLRHGDQDIARPEYRIVVSTEIEPSQEDRPSAFEWLGRMIARHMTRVGKYAVRPF